MMMPCRFARVVSALALVALLAGLAPMPASARPYPPILGAPAGLTSPNLNPPSNKVPSVPRWGSMLDRWRKGMACGPVKMPGAPCTTAGWNEALQRGQGLKGLALLNAVNDAFNNDLKYPYVGEPQGQDYWETPYQFLEKSGDCEDFAIAKFMALEKLGVADQDMMILVVAAKNMGGIGHAILIVFLGDEGYVLDILNKHVMKQAYAQSFYQPLLAVNTKFWMYLHNVT
jgi:predicted transglutaminase-like cysteine proteinase